MRPRRFPVRGWAASELDVRAEVAAVGDPDYSLLAAWDGRAVVVFSAEVLESLGAQAMALANGLDLDLEGGHVPTEERRLVRGASVGLGNLAGRLWAGVPK